MALPTNDEFRDSSMREKACSLLLAKLTRIQHRYRDHNDETLTTSYDCVTCATLENRVKEYEERLYA